MDKYKELADHLRTFGGGTPTSVYQGIVRAVDGLTCEVEIGGIIIPGVRLRASLSEQEAHLLITPAVGSAVIVGSLSGDLAELVVLAVDRVESVVINGGRLGGLVNIEALTTKLNELVAAVNSHVHTSSGKGAPTTPPVSQAQSFTASDYEDATIKH